MENQPYFHTAKAMQDIRIFIEAAVAKIRGVFPYTVGQSKTVAQPHPGTRGAPTGGVSGAKRGRVPARFRSFSLVLSKSCVRGCHREKNRPRAWPLLRRAEVAPPAFRSRAPGAPRQCRSGPRGSFGVPFFLVGGDERDHCPVQSRELALASHVLERNEFFVLEPQRTQ